VEYHRGVSSSDTTSQYRAPQHNITISLLITCVLAEEIAFEISHFCTFQTSVTLTLDWVIPSCITHRPLPTYQILFKHYQFLRSSHISRQYNTISCLTVTCLDIDKPCHFQSVTQLQGGAQLIPSSVPELKVVSSVHVNKQCTGHFNF